MPRILALWLPNWPVQRLVREQPELAGCAIVLYEQDARSGQRVKTCSAAAWEQAVRPGMPLAEAQTLLAEDASPKRERGMNTSPTGERGTDPAVVRGSPDPAPMATGRSHGFRRPAVGGFGGVGRPVPSELEKEVRPLFACHDARRDQEALVELAAWCEQFSPIVGLDQTDEPDSLLMDVSGLAHLFGGEEALAQAVVTACRQQGLTVGVAIADTASAAWGFARWDRSQSHFQVLPPEDAAALDHLPVEALRLPQRTTEQLHRLGIRRIGQLSRLPRASLAARFGEPLIERLDKLVGTVAEPIVAHHAREPLSVRWSFEHPTTHHEAIEHVLGELLSQLSRRLLEQGQGVLRLTCQLVCQNRRPLKINISLFRPVVAPQHLLALAKLQLALVTLPDAVDEIRVRAVTTAPRQQRQGELFGDAPRDHPVQLALLVEQLSNRLGRERVVRAELQAEAQAELAYRYLPLAGEAAASYVPARSALPLPGPLLRPLRLFDPPQPIDCARHRAGRSSRDVSLPAPAASRGPLLRPGADRNGLVARRIVPPRLLPCGNRRGKPLVAVPPAAGPTLVFAGRSLSKALAHMSHTSYASYYAELHCKTNFSFLQGASHPDELVQHAAELGYDALAVTDLNSLAGVVRAHAAAKGSGLKLIVGAEITPVDAPAVVLWATDRAAYGRLCRLITRGRRRAAKGECELTWQDVAEHADGLLAGVLVGDAEGESTWPRLAETRKPVSERPTYVVQGGPRRLGPPYAVLAALDRYREIFPGRCYLIAELHRGAEDERRLELLRHLSRSAGLPLVAAGDVYYHIPARQPLQHVLTAIRHGVTVAQAGTLLFPNAQRHLKSLDELRELFARIPDALQRTRQIADRCTFSLDELRYEYPQELAPPGMTPLEYLKRLTWQGAQQRYPDGVPEKVLQLLRHELQLIAELRYEAYFLTVWDLVQFARSRHILCQGRGSAANSAVCYCLGITAVDPDRMDLLFERFISKERNEAPDIDVDFEHERREEVLQYLYQKYGRERAGIAAAVITYRTRSAIREVGKALGLSLDCIDRLAKNMDGYPQQAIELEQRCQEMGIDTTSEVGRRLLHLTKELIGFPRHLSQHVGGMVMTRGPLCELVPIENAAMPDRTVIEWDKDDLEELGILKVDCLCLGMLTAIRKCFALVQQVAGRQLTLANIPAGDTRVYDMICRADTMGVFQIESRARWPCCRGCGRAAITTW